MKVPARASEPLRILPLTPNLGAEVFGANLSSPSPSEVAEIHRAFLTHGVLVIRDQSLDREQQKAFGRTFGALHVHPTVRYLGRGGDPEIFTIRTTPGSAYGYTLKRGQAYPAAEHPVVVRHPQTGRRLLFVNSSFTSHIPQLPRRESDALLEMLYRHIETGTRFQCRVRWAPGTLTLWDNRCTQHHAVWDDYPNTRLAERVTVAGSAPPAA